MSSCYSRVTNSHLDSKNKETETTPTSLGNETLPSLSFSHSHLSSILTDSLWPHVAIVFPKRRKKKKVLSAFYGFKLQLPFDTDIVEYSCDCKSQLKPMLQIGMNRTLRRTEQVLFRSPTWYIHLFCFRLSFNYIQIEVWFKLIFVFRFYQIIGGLPPPGKMDWRRKAEWWGRGSKGQTWKAEEAVPKTKPFGKLPLFISDAHIWIPNTTNNATKRALPSLNSMLQRERERDFVLKLVTKTYFEKMGVVWAICGGIKRRLT